MNVSYRKGDFEKDRRRRRYAVVIFLPRALDDVVRDLREKFDPDYNLIASHLTLVFPFEDERPLKEITPIIQKEVSGIEPFRIELSSIDDFYPGSPIIYWHVKKNQIIDEIFKNLYTALDLAMPFKEILPHVTLAKEISFHRIMLVKERIVNYLSDEIFVAEAIDLISPVADESWVSVRTFPLIK